MGQLQRERPFALRRCRQARRDLCVNWERPSHGLTGCIERDDIHVASRRLGDVKAIWRLVGKPHSVDDGISGVYREQIVREAIAIRRRDALKVNNRMG
jgi:hypothetical protein